MKGLTSTWFIKSRRAISAKLLVTFTLISIATIGITLDSCKSKAALSADQITGRSWLMPQDVSNQPSQEDWLRFGWQSFVALNWPSDTGSGSIGGQPDTTLSILNPTAATIPTTWMTYLQPGQLFLDESQDPGTWAQPKQPAPTKADPATGQELPIMGNFMDLGLNFITQLPDPLAGLAVFNIALSTNPVVDQNSNYIVLDIRYNQSEFDYITTNKYYDADVQKAAFPDTAHLQNNTFVPFPLSGDQSLPTWARQGAVEVKASWRILNTDPNQPNPDIVDRYYTQKAYVRLADTTQVAIAGPYTLGLVGFHVLRLTPNSKDTWFWTTFEHVDNIKISDPIPNRPNGHPLTPSFNPGPGDEGPTYKYGYDTLGRGLDIPTDIKKSLTGVRHPATLFAGEAMDGNNNSLNRKQKDVPVNMSRITAIPPEVQDINKEYQQLLAGTAWQYYEMINTLNPDPNGPCLVNNIPNDKFDITKRINACAMVNTTIETYLAIKPSHNNIVNCTSCHNDAHAQLPIGAKVTDTNFPPQTFSYMLRRAK